MGGDICLRRKGGDLVLSLLDRKWAEFRICDLFTISPGKRLTKDEMVCGDRPFIGATDSNNGITNFVSNTNMSEDSNVLGVNYNGSVVESFYHPYRCIFSDDVKRLRIRGAEGNRYIYLFLKVVILQQKNKYAYGYKFNEKRMRKQPILLPVSADGQPDYDFMEQYIFERERRLTGRYVEHIGLLHFSGGVQSLLREDERQWTEFNIRDMFPEIKRGKRLKTEDHVEGNVPYISSSARDNGVDDFIGNDAHVRKYENCITLANSGSVGTAFYHCYGFVASDHVTALQSDRLNKYSYLFVATMIGRLREKYSFNREINDTRINKEKVLLPIGSDSQPDCAFMDRYIREREEQLIVRYIGYVERYIYRGCRSLTSRKQL